MLAYDLAQGVARFDCVVIITDHSAFNYETILKEAPLVFDTRNATAGYPAPASCMVVKL
jgi:UDP-N-acetyl-D-glucosamine dehydrogenase